MDTKEIGIIVGVIAVTVIGVVYILHGGDGIALTASLTTIAAILGFKVGQDSQINKP